MLSRIAADLVLVVHLAFILFVVLGGWLVLRRPWVAWLHLPAAAWGAIIELTGGVCPLTPLENLLRIASGSAGFDGGFIDRYLLPVVYPAAMSRTIQILLGLGVILVNVAFYGALIRRWLRSRSGS
jgi:hypothetical protein